MLITKQISNKKIKKHKDNEKQNIKESKKLVNNIEVEEEEEGRRRLKEKLLTIRRILPLMK